MTAYPFEPPKTTFAQGINPFQPRPATMQTPAKPARKNAKRIKDEDYSTPYQPPVAVPAPLVPVVPEGPKKPKATLVYTDPAELQITNDAIPLSRCASVHKYHGVFERMKLGQCVRCSTQDIGKVAGALRKYLELKGMSKTTMIRTVTRYTSPSTGVQDDGHGRVWLLALPAKALK